MQKKCAIVTGGSKGIGAGITERLSEEGYDVFFCYRSHETDAMKLRKRLEMTYGIRCGCTKASLDRSGEAERFFNEAVAYLGRVDLLVNNAGTTIFESLQDLTADKLDYMINLDFRAYIMMMHLAANHMIDHGVHGSIINITSSRGQRAYPADGIYGGLKAGLNRAIESFALDVSSYGIRINNVAPGAIQIRETQDEIIEIMKDPQQIYFWDDLGKRVPLGRIGKPSDIADAVVFLASEYASYITGITLRVDGGLILPGMPERRKEGSDGYNWGHYSL